MGTRIYFLDWDVKFRGRGGGDRERGRGEREKGPWSAIGE